MLGAVVIALLLIDGTPTWLRVAAGGLMMLALLAPALPFLALVPWYLMAVHRGLVPRSAAPYVVAVADGFLVVTHEKKGGRYPLDGLHRARIARNSNWTESKNLEDALSLFAVTGREMTRLPLCASGVDDLLCELQSRSVPIDEVGVSAPAFLD